MKRAIIEATNDFYIDYIVNSPRYKILETGSIYSLQRSRWSKVGSKDKDGYIVLKTWIDGTKVYLRAHRIVYAKYIGRLNESMVVHHKDHNRANNSVKNLTLVTWQENSSIQKRGRINGKD